MMADFVTIWWVWLSAAFALAIIEIMAPGFIFLGFAIGAAVMTVIVALVPSPIGTEVSLAIFAGLSLLAWIGLRLFFAKRQSAAKFFKHDIND